MIDLSIEKLDIDQGHFNGPMWTAIEKYYAKRLETLRLKNENPLDEIDTAKIRGQISEIRKLLKLNPIHDLPSKVLPSKALPSDT